MTRGRIKGMFICDVAKGSFADTIRVSEMTAFSVLYSEGWGSMMNVKPVGLREHLYT